MRKNFYIKRCKKIGGLEVWIVDGVYIRKNIDIEFISYGQHYEFPFIPKNEFWIDKEYSHNEKRYYIMSMLITRRLMARGTSYNKAVARANIIERNERKKSKLIQLKIKKIPKKKLIQEVHKKLWIKYFKI